jgi:predicted O-methyltransferase YrrM
MPLELVSAPVVAYLDTLVPERPAEMQAMEAYAAEHHFPIVGPQAGYFCYLVARMARAQSVFELGSGYGYSTAWFARAVREKGGGVVHHVVWDAQLSQRARGHLSALGYGDLIRYTVGEAVDALRNTSGPFDLIFLDIQKEAYSEALEVIEAKLLPGGVLIADNVLWSGRIFDSADDSPQTAGIRDFTNRIATSPRWITSVVPIRDGLVVALKHS